MTQKSEQLIFTVDALGRTLHDTPDMQAARLAVDHLEAMRVAATGRQIEAAAGVAETEADCARRIGRGERVAVEAMTSQARERLRDADQELRIVTDGIAQATQNQVDVAWTERARLLEVAKAQLRPQAEALVPLLEKVHELASALVPQLHAVKVFERAPGANNDLQSYLGFPLEHVVSRVDLAAAALRTYLIEG